MHRKALGCPDKNKQFPFFSPIPSMMTRLKCKQQLIFDLHLSGNRNKLHFYGAESLYKAWRILQKPLVLCGLILQTLVYKSQLRKGIFQQLVATRFQKLASLLYRQNCPFIKFKYFFSILQRKVIHSTFLCFTEEIKTGCF